MTDLQLAFVLKQLQSRIQSAYAEIDIRLVGELDAPKPDQIADILMPLNDIINELDDFPSEVRKLNDKH